MKKELNSPTKCILLFIISFVVNLLFHEPLMKSILTSICIAVIVTLVGIFEEKRKK